MTRRALLAAALLAFGAPAARADVGAGPPVRLSATGAPADALHDGQQPRLAYDRSAHRGLAVWVAEAQGGADATVVVRALDARGAASGPQRALAGLGTHVGGAEVAPAGGGRFEVVAIRGAGASRDEVVGELVDARGRGGVPRVLATPKALVGSVAVAASRGRLELAWTQAVTQYRPAAGLPLAFARRVDPGRPLGATAVLGRTSSALQFADVALAAVARGWQVVVHRDGVRRAGGTQDITQVVSIGRRPGHARLLTRAKVDLDGAPVLRGQAFATVLRRFDLTDPRLLVRRVRGDGRGTGPQDVLAAGADFSSRPAGLQLLPRTHGRGLAVFLQACDTTGGVACPASSPVRVRGLDRHGRPVGHAVTVAPDGSSEARDISAVSLGGCRALLAYPAFAGVGAPLDDSRGGTVVPVKTEIDLRVLRLC